MTRKGKGFLQGVPKKSVILGNRPWKGPRDKSWGSFKKFRKFPV